MTKDEALRLALEALEYTGLKWPQVEEAITAIKAALEAKDEPWESEMRNELVALGFDGQCPESIGITLKRWRDGYASAQRTWVGLTDEEIIIMSRYDLEYAALIGEVQRKLKEKNT